MADKPTTHKTRVSIVLKTSQYFFTMYLNMRMCIMDVNKRKNACINRVENLSDAKGVFMKFRDLSRIVRKTFYCTYM